MRSSDIKNGPLSNMVAVGTVGASSARIWFRSQRPGNIKISCRPEGGQGPVTEAFVNIVDPNDSDNTSSIWLPQNANPSGLSPRTRYVFEVRRADDGHLIGEGRFETAPQATRDTPPRFSFALMSCNQPFKDDGTLNRRSLRMLRAARRCLAEHDAKFVLMVGDQVYTDYPRPLSLFNPDYFKHLAPPGRPCIQACSEAKVRRIFHDRYRRFWNVSEWQTIHAEYPSYPIVDDHDLVDNWGSDPAHQTPQWQHFGQGARQAYVDYQGSRVLGSNNLLRPSFHYAFAYGHTATFVMDLRSERTAGEKGQLYSTGQFRDLSVFLKDHTDKKVLFLVLSVPIIHLPKSIAAIAARMTHSGEDFSDRWSSGSHVRDRDRLFKLLHDHQVRHPRQKLVLLSGDIHVGCAQKIQWQAPMPPFYQLISSGITHSLGRMLQIAAKILISMNNTIVTQDGSLTGKVGFLKGTRSQIQNPYGGMNLGIVEIDTPPGDAPPRLQFSLYGHLHERPVCVYRSVVF